MKADLPAVRARYYDQLTAPQRRVFDRLQAAGASVDEPDSLRALVSLLDAYTVSEAVPRSVAIGTKPGTRPNPELRGVRPPPTEQLEGLHPELLGLVDASSGVPFYRRSWMQLSASETGALESLGFSATSWDAVRDGDLGRWPEAWNTEFAALGPEQRAAVQSLGFDDEAWDGELLMRKDLLAQPRIMNAFVDLAQSGVIREEGVREGIIAAGRRGMAETPSRKRALLYLLDFHGHRFSEGARLALRGDIAHQTFRDQIATRAEYGAFSSLGWNASIAPTPTAAARGSTMPAIVNDASGRSVTLVRSVVEAETIDDVRNALLRAKELRRAGLEVGVSVAGRRHSMGGHSSLPGSINIDMMKMNRIKLSADGSTLTVGSGATWAQVLQTLEAAGKSPKTMQDYDVFTVGGSLSVNIHGRTPGLPPFISTVRSLRVMDADGQVHTCSREQNSELFRHVIGGYGLFGVVLDVELELTDNPQGIFRAEVVSESDFPARFAEVIDAPGTELAWGRLSPTFNGEVLLHWVRRSDAQPDHRGLDYERANLRRVEQLVLGATNKFPDLLEARWWLEKSLRKGEAKGTRKDFLGLNADGLRQMTLKEGKEAGILQEFFIPRANFQQFVDGMKRIREGLDAPMIATTLRDVPKDEESALPFAKEDCYAFVLYDLQQLTEEGFERAGELNRQLVDLALACGGTFYLPYQKHYTRAQLLAAYPEADAFFASKRRYDPTELFSNAWYAKYGRAETESAGTDGK